MSTPRAEQYEKIPPEREQAIIDTVQHAPFPKFLGLEFQEVRAEYARMYLPYRPEFPQPAGMVHGGVIATLIDTVVVGPLLSMLEKPPRKLLTIDMHVHYLGAVLEEDLIAEGWTRKRGRSTAFVAAEVSTASGEIVAQGEMAYRIVT